MAGVSLVYLSSRTLGYKNVLKLSLISDSEIPLVDVVDEVRVQIIVEGAVYEETLEVVSSLNFTFTWNGLDAYNQKVYGVVPVEGKILKCFN